MNHLSLRYLYIAALALLSGGCAKRLDITPQGSPTLTDFWKTQTDAENADNALFSNFGNSNGSQDEFYGRGYFWFINASDDISQKRESFVRRLLLANEVKCVETCEQNV